MIEVRSPLLVGVAVAVLLGAGWLLLVDPPSTAPTWSAARGTLSAADRDALAAVPVGQGAAPAGPDPRVNFASPSAVAAAYVAAAYTTRDSDAGLTNRRAVPYAAPGTPPNTVGVLVLTPPPPGSTSTATVTDVTEVSRDITDHERGYLVGYRLTRSPAPTDAMASARQIRYLLLVRQLDGRWLVTSDTADAPTQTP